MSPTHQDLSNDTTFSQIKSCVPVPLKEQCHQIFLVFCLHQIASLVPLEVPGTYSETISIFAEYDTIPVSILWCFSNTTGTVPFEGWI